MQGDAKTFVFWHNYPIVFMINVGSCLDVNEILRIKSVDVTNSTSEDDSEDVSVLVDKVIHNAHKQVTVEARTVQERVSQASQSIQGWLTNIHAGTGPSWVLKLTLFLALPLW